MIDPNDIPETKLQTEEEWEEEILLAALGDALKPDGSLDFDQLRASSIPTTLEELFPEGDDKDES